MRIRSLVTLVLATVAAASAQQGTVQNAAAFQASATLGFILDPIGGTFAYTSFLLGSPAIGPNVISPRMLAVLTYSASAPDIYTIAVPVAVAASVWIRPVGSTTLIPVNVVSAIPGQIKFVVPAAVPTGGAELLYQVNGQATQWTTLHVVASSFAFFPSSSAGLTTPVQPGETVVLTGSGLGYGASTSATIGGVDAPVLYAGPDVTETGRDRVLLQVPTGAPDGCYVPVAFAYNKTTVTTTISKTSDGSPCKHPWQLSAADMKTLDGGGSIANAVLSLSTQSSEATATAVSHTESANLGISQIDASGIASYFSPAANAPGTACSTPSASGLVGVAAFRAGDFSGVPPSTGPDIGSSLDLLSGTTDLKFNGFTATIPQSDGAPVLVGGNWTLRTGGGNDLAPSSFAFTLPNPIQLGGSPPVTLIRNQDQTISWNGAAFDSTGTVNLTLSGATALPVTCVAPAKAGSVVIPAELLSAFQPGTLATLTINATHTGAGELPLKSGANLLMLVSWSSSDSRPAVIQ